MSQKHVSLIAAALVFALDAMASGYPEGCNAHIFPDGPFRADDGRPAKITSGELLDWQMNAEIAAELIAQFEADGKPILYDYEHNSMYGDSRAAGWIDKLVYAAGRGLFAHVEWTPAAATAIGNKEFLFSSPYFYFDGKTGVVKKLISVALTNSPALEELDAVGLRRKTGLPTQQEANMADAQAQAALAAERDNLKTQLTTLTAERDDLKTQNAALTTERDALKAKADAADAEKAAAALAADQAKHAELLQAALTDGTLTPAQKPWAEKLSTAALKEYIDATKPLSLTQTQADGKDTGAHGLSQEELAMCSRMGVKPEDFVKAKASA